MRSLLILLFMIPCSSLCIAQTADRVLRVDAPLVREQLLAEEDTDADTRLTVDDPRVPGTGRGDKRFWMRDLDGRPWEITGTYHLANLLQELTLRIEAGSDTAEIPPASIFEPPTQRLSRFIRDHFWDGLTRRIDERNLATVLTDDKTRSKDGFQYLYVPSSDTQAFRYFSGVAAEDPSLNLRVVRLPTVITPDFLRSLEGTHGILSLALRPSGTTLEGVPYVVPGGRFNEMYGWDSYFITLGLLKDGRTGLARSMVDNFVYQITRYGKILNANRTYYLTRSQPPFLTSMIRAVLGALPANDATTAWLKESLSAAILEYHSVWMSPERLTSTGLQRYFDSGTGPPPEVEPGHYDAVFRAFAQRRGMDPAQFEQGYRAGRIKDPELDSYFVHDRCMRESGHDTSYRLDNCCADLVTVDLNSLLYKTEMDIAVLLGTYFEGVMEYPDGRRELSKEWRERAERRKALMDRYLWDEERGMYFDYNVRTQHREEYVAATTMYPLWSGAASSAQAAALVENALPLLEQAGGIVSSTEHSRGPVTDERPQRQWDFPHGWAPHQMLAWEGLKNFGFHRETARLAYRWLYTITINAVHYNGTVTEKYDVVNRSHEVFAEYGNIGATFSYITREGFGWTNASYQVALSFLSPGQRSALDRLTPPEWIF